MTRDDILRMTREAHLDVYGLGKDHQQFMSAVECVAYSAFTAGALAERERLKWDGLHSCHPECDRPACVHTRKAVEAEREACAVIAFNAKTYIEAAKAIRARSK